MLIYHSELEKQFIGHRTNRTNRTFWGRRCTVFVRCVLAMCTVEALIFLHFVRNVRFVRKILYTHIYRTYIFHKMMISARARVEVYQNTVQTVQTVHCP